MQDIFSQIELTVTQENKKEIDKVIHNLVGVNYKDCSATWKKVKKHLAENQDEFVSKLKQELHV